MSCPLARSVAARFVTLPQVRAIALGGSEGAGEADALSDVDLYIYAEEPISAEDRRAIAADFATRMEIDNRFWEPGDEWIDRISGRGVDIMYRSPAWIEEQLERVLRRHEASIGYSTCLWWNVLHSEALYDSEAWYAGLQQAARQPYPDPLREAIIARNLPILRRNISSYRRQIEIALLRRDFVSVNHRVAAFLASYWDIVFAVNSLPHPGEKRILEHARRLCARLPEGCEETVEALLQSPSLQVLDRLAEGLEEILPQRHHR